MTKHGLDEPHGLDSHGPPPVDPSTEVASYEFVDHTSELTIRLRAPSYEELAAEATRALAKIMLRSLHGPIHQDPREVCVKGADRGAILVALLNELIYLGEVEQWAAVEIDRVLIQDDELRIQARGTTLAKPFVFAKAATFHGLDVREGPTGVEAEVTLDV